MYNVLIADDDPFILDGLRCIVDWNALGLQIVASASSGKEAMKHIQNLPIHVLLTDIRMPDVDGLALIRWIRANQYDIRCIVLSGYDDYVYLKQALQLKIENYLIKSVNEEELLDTLKHVVEKLEQGTGISLGLSRNILADNVLFRWATGQISPLEFEERMRFLDRPIGAGFFQVCMLRPLERKAEVFKTLLCHLSTSANCEGPLHIFQSLEQDLIMIYSAPDKIQLDKNLQAVTNQIMHLISSPYFLTVGQDIIGYENVALSYRAAKHLQNYAITDPTMRFLAYDIPTPECEKKGSLEGPEIELFYQSLLQGDQEKLQSFLQQFFCRDYDYRIYASDYVQVSTIRLSYCLNDAMRTLFLNSPNLLIPNDVLYQNIYSFPSRAKLAEWFFEQTTLFLKERLAHQSVENPILKRTLHYIDTHYQEEISLKTISLVLNTNTAYLGRIFKAEIGRSFSSYLNLLRIEKSKALLLQTNYTVSEIAIKTGYNSTNYYVNTFKKITGYFPLQYRSTHNRNTTQ